MRDEPIRPLELIGVIIAIHCVFPAPWCYVADVCAVVYTGMVNL